MLHKPSVSQNHHPHFITHVIQLSYLNKCSNLVDIIQTCNSLRFTATKLKDNKIDSDKILISYKCSLINRNLMELTSKRVWVCAVVCGIVTHTLQRIHLCQCAFESRGVLWCICTSAFISGLHFPVFCCDRSCMCICAVSGLQLSRCAQILHVGCCTPFPIKHSFWDVPPTLSCFHCIRQPWD